MAEYQHGAGRVIVTTITLEFAGHEPVGSGPSLLLTNLFSYALDETAGEHQEADESDGIPEGSAREKPPTAMLRNKSGGFLKDGSGSFLGKRLVGAVRK